MKWTITFFIVILYQAIDAFKLMKQSSIYDYLYSLPNELYEDYTQYADYSESVDLLNWQSLNDKDREREKDRNLNNININNPLSLIETKEKTYKTTSLPNSIKRLIENYISSYDDKLNPEIFSKVMKKYSISKDDAIDLFMLIDKNKNNFIEEKEYTTFYNIIGTDFNNCNESYIIAKKKFLNCLERDKDYKQLQIHINNSSSLFSSLDTEDKKYLTLYDFVILKQSFFIFNVLINKHNKVDNTNFYIGIRLSNKNVHKQLSKFELERLYNRTSTYFPDTSQVLS